MDRWLIDEDNEADWFVQSPDGHRFYFGNIEDISKCCFENARFIVNACNRGVDNKDTTLELLKAYVNFRKFVDTLETAVGIIENENLDKCDNNLVDIILDLLGIPDDRTVEEEQGFCRDWYYTKIFDLKNEEDCEKCIEEIVGSIAPSGAI